MALVKVLRLMSRFPHLEVGNIYKLDDFEAKKIYTDESLKEYRACLARMPEIYAGNAKGKISFGLPKPTVKPKGPSMMEDVAKEKKAQAEKSVASVEEVFSKVDEEKLTKEIEEANAYKEAVAPIVSEALKKAVQEKAEGERRQDLLDLHYTKVKEIGDKYGIEYTSKTEVIDAIIQKEYYGNK